MCVSVSLSVCAYVCVVTLAVSEHYNAAYSNKNTWLLLESQLKFNFTNLYVAIDFDKIKIYIDFKLNFYIFCLLFFTICFGTSLSIKISRTVRIGFCITLQFTWMISLSTAKLSAQLNSMWQIWNAHTHTHTPQQCSHCWLVWPIYVYFYTKFIYIISIDLPSISFRPRVPSVKRQKMPTGHGRVHKKPYRNMTLTLMNYYSASRVRGREQQ